MDVLVTQALSAYKNRQALRRELDLAEAAHDQAVSFLQGEQFQAYVEAVAEDRKRQQAADKQTFETAARLLAH